MKRPITRFEVNLQVQGSSFPRHMPSGGGLIFCPTETLADEQNSGQLYEEA